jgi:two-component system response regulator GlrR
MHQISATSEPCKAGAAPGTGCSSVPDAEMTKGTKGYSHDATERAARVARLGKLASRSPKMKLALAALKRTAGSELNLLIEGETGVGKELAAECVHHASRRSAGPFLVFDCAAKSANAGELELFGLEQDASSCTPGMPGILELASGGTLLLDHVDELAMPSQARLLRAFEQRRFRRIGGSEAIALDLRVISASSRSLGRAVRRRAFTRELHAHLGAAYVHLPPPRQRMEDLTLIAEEFLASLQPPRDLSDISDSVWAAFREHRWPGNLRELRNALSYALLVPDHALRSRGP